MEKENKIIDEYVILKLGNVYVEKVSARNISFTNSESKAEMFSIGEKWELADFAYKLSKVVEYGFNPEIIQITVTQQKESKKVNLCIQGIDRFCLKEVNKDGK